MDDHAASPDGETAIPTQEELARMVKEATTLEALLELHRKVVAWEQAARGDLRAAGLDVERAARLLREASRRIEARRRPSNRKA